MPFGCFHFTRSLNPSLRGSPPPPTLHPYRSACGIGVAKKPSNLAGNLRSASYSFNSIQTMNRTMANCMQASVLTLQIIKIGISKYLYRNCVQKQLFSNLVTHIIIIYVLAYSSMQCSAVNVQLAICMLNKSRFINQLTTYGSYQVILLLVFLLFVAVIKIILFLYFYSVARLYTITGLDWTGLLDSSQS